MRSSFSFCGVDVRSIGLEYAPEVKDTYVYAPAVSNVHEETFEGHDGGYSYGASKEPKTFTLRCFYEEEHVAHGLMARVQNLFRVGKKGMLIFERRPWCYYYATVTEVNIEDMRNYLNGIITITMKAYYPFARGLPVVSPQTKEEHLFCNVIGDPYHAEILQNTAILDKSYMVPNTTFIQNPELYKNLYNPAENKAVIEPDTTYTISMKATWTFGANVVGTIYGYGQTLLEPYEYVIGVYAYDHDDGQVTFEKETFTTQEDVEYLVFEPGQGVTVSELQLEKGSRSTSYVPYANPSDAWNDPILLYNPGTERAKVDIVISGEAGDGVTINNNTTKQASKYVAFHDDDGDIHTDGISGKTYHLNQEQQPEIAFLYHDYGFIELEPAFPILRDLFVRCEGTTVATTNILYQHEDEMEWYVGKYIFIGTDNTGSWKKIVRCVDKHTLLLSSAGQTCTCKTCVVLMNEIKVTPTNNTNISKLSFIYKPTYS